MVTEVIKSKDGHVCIHGNGMKSKNSEYYCLSTDTKPKEGVENADILYEMDTQAVFMFDYDSKNWIEQK
jgi:hypothetical protein